MVSDFPVAASVTERGSREVDRYSFNKWCHFQVGEYGYDHNKKHDAYKGNDPNNILNWEKPDKVGPGDRLMWLVPAHLRQYLGKSWFAVTVTGKLGPDIFHRRLRPLSRHSVLPDRQPVAALGTWIHVQCDVPALGDGIVAIDHFTLFKPSEEDRNKPEYIREWKKGSGPGGRRGKRSASM